MNRIAKFEKVSYEQFKKDWLDAAPFTSGSWFGISEEDFERTVRNIYDSIKLPVRATSGSAGYDFFCPYRLMIPPKDAVKIPTGIRCKMENGWVLQTYPRSGYGFKTGVHLANTVGIIDEDYYHSDNEGHIFIKLVNDSALAKLIDIEKGEAFCQGIFVPYGITTDDNVTAIRNGGFGSTSKQK